jgi:hypothetical protein
MFAHSREVRRKNTHVVLASRPRIILERRIIDK